MGANVWPVDAVTGAPSYTGRLLRQLTGLGWTRNPARPLGVRSGVVWGTPNTIASATSTTWTVTPFGGVIDGETSAVAGGYNFSFDTNQTGSVTAADATNPRIDLLYVKVSDPAEGDGSTNPIIQLLYLAGTAAASPTVPATPARSIPVATILVPKSGTGSPSTSFVATYATGAGAALPVYSQTERDALTLFTGLRVVRLDQVGRMETYTGSGWWSQPIVKQFSGTTDASGYITLTHGLGWTPAAITATPNSPITAGANASIFAIALTDSFTSTTFRVRALSAAIGQMATTAIVVSCSFG